MIDANAAIVLERSPEIIPKSEVATIDRDAKFGMRPYNRERASPGTGCEAPAEITHRGSRTGVFGSRCPLELR